MKATVMADASFCPDTHAAGWEVWITIDAPVPRRCKSFDTFHELPKSSHDAELWAALNGIYLAVKEGVRFILLQIDCMTVIDLIRSKGIKFQKHFNQIENRFSSKVTIVVKHVKAHTNKADKRSYVNDWCDEKAKLCMRKQRSKIRRENDRN